MQNRRPDLSGAAGSLYRDDGKRTRAVDQNSNVADNVAERASPMATTVWLTLDG